MPLSSTGRKFWLVCSLMIGAFIATVVVIHIAGGGTSSASVASRDSALQRVAEHPSGAAAKARVNDPPGINVQPNPAAQKAGPPDPSMQSAAATGAENAAKAAADLAAK